MFNRIYKKRKGVALPMVMGLIMLLSVLFLAMYAILSNNTYAINSDALQKELFYHAKSGVMTAESALYATISGEKNKILKDIQVDNFLVLTDTLTSDKISKLPEDISIDIKISFVTDISSSRYGMVRIDSIAKNTSHNLSRTLTKYVDPMGVNSIYE